MFGIEQQKRKREVAMLRELSKKYMDAAQRQNGKKVKNAWRRLHDCSMERPMIYVWCILFTDEFEEIANPICETPIFREIEKKLKIDLYHYATGDDYILEPFIKIGPQHLGLNNGVWGVSFKKIHSEGGADQVYNDPPLKSLDDLSMIQPAAYSIDEKSSAEIHETLNDAIGDILPVYVGRQPPYSANLASVITKMRGMSQLMMDMVDNPEGLHRLSEKMYQAASDALDQADKNGGFSSPDQFIQSCPYSNYTVDPFPMEKAHRKDLWCFAHAQEFTLISPDMHKEFAIDYQKPIMEQYAASAYGCCEDITHKIDILRSIKNLKQISVTPASNLEKCAEQIGSDYVISWRPNPTDHVCTNFDRNRIERKIMEGCAILNKYGCHYEINLKDVVSVHKDRSRIPEWIKIVRNIIE